MAVARLASPVAAAVDDVILSQRSTYRARLGLCVIPEFVCLTLALVGAFQSVAACLYILLIVGVGIGVLTVRQCWDDQAVERPRLCGAASPLLVVHILFFGRLSHFVLVPAAFTEMYVWQARQPEDRKDLGGVYAALAIVWVFLIVTGVSLFFGYKLLQVSKVDLRMNYADAVSRFSVRAIKATFGLTGGTGSSFEAFHRSMQPGPDNYWGYASDPTEWRSIPSANGRLLHSNAVGVVTQTPTPSGEPYGQEWSPYTPVTARQLSNPHPSYFRPQPTDPVDNSQRMNNASGMVAGAGEGVSASDPHLVPTTPTVPPEPTSPFAPHSALRSIHNTPTMPRTSVNGGPNPMAGPGSATRRQGSGQGVLTAVPLMVEPRALQDAVMGTVLMQPTGPAAATAAAPTAVPLNDSPERAPDNR